MNSILLFSDLHLRPESQAVCSTVLDGVLEQALNLGVGTIGFLGDFWHIRYNVPVHLVNLVDRWLLKCQQNVIEVIFLPGNHDQVDEAGENALSVFRRKGVRVHDDPTIDEWGAWCPYRKPEFVPEILKSLRQKKPIPLFAHLPVKGAMMNNLKVDEHGISIGEFKGFKQVLLGHYHKQQTFLGGVAHYIGSPWQTRADEWGQDKGVAVWDGVKFHRIQKDWGPKHYRFDASDFVEGQAIPGNPGDTIRLSVPGVTDGWKQWAQNHPAKVILEDTTEQTVQPRFAFQEGTGLSEYVNQYILDKAKPDQNLDEKVLWHMWDELQ
jgi:hypothetical protein